MGKPYIKLDLDWHEDPKVLEFQMRYGKAALVDLIDLDCALGEFYGSIDLGDTAQRMKLERYVGKRGKALAKFLDKVASCGLIDAEAYKELRRIGSERSVRDGECRRNRREYALAASDAAKRKRLGAT